jgi:hypothetical protein
MRMRAARVAGGRFFCCMAVAGGVRACEESLVGSGLEGWRWLGFICELKMIFAINLYGNTGDNYPTQIWESRIRSGNSPNCFRTRCILVFPLVFQFFLKNDTIGLCGVGGRWTGRRTAEEGRRDSCRWRRKRGMCMMPWRRCASGIKHLSISNISVRPTTHHAQTSLNMQEFHITIH